MKYYVAGYYSDIMDMEFTGVVLDNPKVYNTEEILEHAAVENCCQCQNVFHDIDELKEYLQDDDDVEIINPQALEKFTEEEWETGIAIDMDNEVEVISRIVEDYTCEDEIFHCEIFDTREKAQERLEEIVENKKGALDVGEPGNLYIFRNYQYSPNRLLAVIEDYREGDVDILKGSGVDYSEFKSEFSRFEWNNTYFMKREEFTPEEIRAVRRAGTELEITEHGMCDVYTREDTDRMSEEE